MKSNGALRTCRTMALIIALSFVVAVSCYSKRLAAEWVYTTLGCVMDVSAILFGVYGIWLGLFYRPDAVASLRGKQGRELEKQVTEVIVAANRFRIILRGLVVSAIVLVFSMFARTLNVPIKHIVVDCWPSAMPVFKWILFFMVGIAVVMQGYGIVIAIAPMYEAKKRMAEAKDDAELIKAL